LSHPTDRELCVIKQMSSLRTFIHRDRAAAPWPTNRVRAFCSLPHQLRLTNLPFGHTDLTPELIQQLIHLPTLTHLAPRAATVDCLPLLHHFHQLRHLRLVALNFRTILPHVRGLAQLRTLHLVRFRVDSDASLVQVMSLMSHLTALTLERSELRSLVGLCASPALTSLRFRTHGRSLSTQCRQLVSCTQLTHLEVRDIEYASRWSADEVCQLMPPLAHLPVLKTFVYHEYRARRRHF
jgi:hypothetical protein